MASNRVVLPPPLTPPNRTMGRRLPCRCTGDRSKTCCPRNRQKLRSVSLSRIIASSLDNVERKLLAYDPPVRYKTIQPRQGQPRTQPCPTPTRTSSTTS